MRILSAIYIGVALLGLSSCASSGTQGPARHAPTGMASAELANLRAAVLYSENSVDLFNEARKKRKNAAWMEIGMLPIEFRKRFNRNFKSVKSIGRLEDGIDADIVVVWDASAVFDEKLLKVGHGLVFYDRNNKEIESVQGEAESEVSLFHAGKNAHEAVTESLSALVAAMLGSETLAQAAKVIVRDRPPENRGSPSQANLQAMMEAAARKALQARGPAPSAKKPLIHSDIDKPKYKTPQDPDKFALVVGIEKYSGVPEALYAERDAVAMRNHLLAMGYPQRNIILLTGDKATKTGLTKYIETWLPRNITAKSSLFFYYSGHGAPDIKSGQAYLVPWDGDPQFLKDTAYPLKRLYEKMGALKAKRVVMAMDSCFSGAGGRSLLAKGSRPLVGKVAAVDSVADNIVAFSAAGSDQISGTIEAEGHGAFTYFLLKGLGGEALDSEDAVTVQSLYDYLSPNVADAARRENRDQMPQLIQASDGIRALRLR